MSSSAIRTTVVLGLVILVACGWLLFGSTTTRTTDTDYRCKRSFGRVTTIIATPISTDGAADPARAEILPVPWGESAFSCETALEIATGVSWPEEH